MIGSAACHTWHDYDYVSSEPQQAPSRLRATRHDSSQVVVTEAVLRNDTLYGFSRNQQVIIPMRDIGVVEREKLSVTRTLATVVGVPAALAGLIYLIQCGDGGCQPDY
jgi:hypothetical protein